MQFCKQMNKLRAAIANLMFAIILLIPLQVLAESDLEPNEEIFASVCRDYEIIGPSTKCESNLYEVEVPLIYKHELPVPRYINLSTDGVDLIFR